MNSRESAASTNPVSHRGDERDDLSRLLTSAQQGCVDSLGGALEACWQYLLLIANQELCPELRCKAGASDLVQDTMLEAHRDFRQFRGDTKQELIAWLRDILRNNLRDFHKSYQRTGKRQFSREQSKLGSDGKLAARVATTDPSPSSVVVKAEARELIDSAIHRLPPDQREVIRLRHGEGLLFEQIGVQMGRTTDAARQLWCRAVRAISRELTDS